MRRHLTGRKGDDDNKVSFEVSSPPTVLPNKYRRVSSYFLKFSLDNKKMTLRFLLSVFLLGQFFVSPPLAFCKSIHFRTKDCLWYNVFL